MLTPRCTAFSCNEFLNDFLNGRQNRNKLRHRNYVYQDCTVSKIKISHYKTYLLASYIPYLKIKKNVQLSINSFDLSIVEWITEAREWAPCIWFNASRSDCQDGIPDWFRYDTNITTRVPDFRRLYTCRCATMQIVVAVLFTIKKITI